MMQPIVFFTAPMLFAPGVNAPIVYVPIVNRPMPPAPVTLRCKQLLYSYIQTYSENFLYQFVNLLQSFPDLANTTDEYGNPFFSSMLHALEIENIEEKKCFTLTFITILVNNCRLNPLAIAYRTNNRATVDRVLELFQLPIVIQIPNLTTDKLIHTAIVSSYQSLGFLAHDFKDAFQNPSGALSTNTFLLLLNNYKKDNANIFCFFISLDIDQLSIFKSFQVSYDAKLITLQLTDAIKKNDPDRFQILLIAAFIFTNTSDLKPIIKNAEYIDLIEFYNNFACLKYLVMAQCACLGEVATFNHLHFLYQDLVKPDLTKFQNKFTNPVWWFMLKITSKNKDDQQEAMDFIKEAKSDAYKIKDHQKTVFNFKLFAPHNKPISYEEQIVYLPALKS